ncbi:MAG: PAS domain S-box protein [Salinivirgaceae bacterium]|nr:PAS domain S-box protein [Salinivirgaceae bacterium]
MENYLKKELYDLIKKDERIFDFIQESSLDGLWYWDLENPENEWMNARFWTTIGYNPENMPHKSDAWQSIINQDDLKTALNNFTKHLQDPDQPYDQIVRYTHKNGSTVWIRCRGMAIRDEQGKPIRMLGAHHDITDLRTAENDLISTVEKYQTLFTQMIDGFAYHELILDKKGKPIDYITLEVNKAYEKLLNTKAALVIGKKASEMLSKKELEYWLGIFGPVALTGESAQYELYLPGNEKYFEGRAFCPEKNKFAITFLDVTLRKQAENDLNEKNKEIEAQNEEYKQINEELKIAKEKAEENELQLNSILENSPTGFAINRISTGEVIYVNKAFANAYHIPIELCSKVSTFFEYVYSDQMVLGNKILNDVKSEDPERMKWNFVPVNDKKTGKLFYVSASNIILKEIDLMISTVIDITSQIKNEKELKFAKEKAEESDRLKTAFLQNISHEIRTPMNAINGFAGILNKPDLSEEKRNSFISIIQNSSKQLLSIVSNILTISSIDAKQEKLCMENVCINDIIVDLVAIFKPQAVNQNISLFAKQQLSDSQAEIYTDKTKVTQILSNLISNAFKFTHKGSIEFGYNLKENELEFYVKDSGIGIKPELREKIFERFQQADSSITRKYGGTGLGLSISNGFVELLGGKIWVESESDKGSAFYFTIPYKPVHNKERTKLGTKQNEKIPTILVAEDEEFNFLYIEELLIDFDLQLIHAKDGKEAFEIVKANPTIDMVLMDIKMPIMTGDEAAKIIKELKLDLPIIAQSAYALENERAQYEGIFDDYLTKPISEDALKQTVLKYFKE